ncbi:GNAT family N-acetyltransferase [Exiguobacterium sp.]|uniref:GNAT family N-acetyltransferase n=1 Tax=Exiguobacterium sp. TaxID=44751 RepID=UPI00391B5FA3
MTFETTRCLIRPFQERDLVAFMNYRNDLEWMQHQSFKGLTVEEYKRSLLSEPSIVNGIQLAIISKETNVLIGDLYIHQEDTTYWIGYTITPQQSRQGYAVEVVSGLIAQLTARGAKTIKAGALAANEASIALLQKLDFVYIETEDDEQIYQLAVSK